jgi:hypothetical protein
MALCKDLGSQVFHMMPIGSQELASVTRATISPLHANDDHQT